jgi:uncharacterized membrane protein
MVRVEKSVDINRPVDQVFYVVGTKYVRNHPRWSPSLKEFRQISDGPFGVGTELHELREVNGNPVARTVRITEYLENQSLAFESAGDSSKSSGKYTFQPAGSGTRVTFVLDTEIGGLSRLAAPVIARAVGNDVESDMNRMKEMLENPSGSG